MAMKFVVGIEDILEDVRYTNHTCHNCPCYKCMILRWAKYPDRCMCHLDLRKNWGLDMAVHKTRLSCKCWKYYLLLSRLPLSLHGTNATSNG